MILVNFSADFSGISDLRLVDNCLKMTAYDLIGGNESKTVILDTENKIPCDLQGFADDLALLATTEAPKVKGLQCFDADTLREMTQKSLEHIIYSWVKKTASH